MPTREELEQVENNLICDGNLFITDPATGREWEFPNSLVHYDLSYDLSRPGNAVHFDNATRVIIPPEWEPPIRQFSPERWDELARRVDMTDWGKLYPPEHFVYGTQSVLDEVAGVQKKLNELYNLTEPDEGLPTNAYIVNFE